MLRLVKVTMWQRNVSRCFLAPVGWISPGFWESQPLPPSLRLIQPCRESYPSNALPSVFVWDFCPRQWWQHEKPPTLINPAQWGCHFVITWIHVGEGSISESCNIIKEYWSKSGLLVQPKELGRWSPHWKVLIWAHYYWHLCSLTHTV